MSGSSASPSLDFDRERLRWERKRGRFRGGVAGGGRAADRALSEGYDIGVGFERGEGW
jgi:hypothetical protein